MLLLALVFVSEAVCTSVLLFMLFIVSMLVFVFVFESASAFWTEERTRRMFAQSVYYGSTYVNRSCFCFSFFCYWLCVKFCARFWICDVDFWPQRAAIATRTVDFCLMMDVGVVSYTDRVGERRMPHLAPQTSHQSIRPGQLRQWATLLVGLEKRWSVDQSLV